MRSRASADAAPRASPASRAAVPRAGGSGSAIAPRKSATPLQCIDSSRKMIRRRSIGPLISWRRACARMRSTYPPSMLRTRPIGIARRIRQCAETAAFEAGSERFGDRNADCRAVADRLDAVLGTANAALIAFPRHADAAPPASANGLAGGFARPGRTAFARHANAPRAACGDVHGERIGAHDRARMWFCAADRIVVKPLGFFHNATAHRCAARKRRRVNEFGRT